MQIAHWCPRCFLHCTIICVIACSIRLSQLYDWTRWSIIQYIPRNMHAVFALLCFVVVIHWLIFLYPSGLLHWHCGNLTIAPVPAKQPWWIWINTSCEFIMNDCITTTKQSTTKPCAYFLGYTVRLNNVISWSISRIPTIRRWSGTPDLLTYHLSHCGPDKMSTASQTIFSHAFLWMKDFIF